MNKQISEELSEKIYRSFLANGLNTTFESEHYDESKEKMCCLSVSQPLEMEDKSLNKRISITIKVKQVKKDDDDFEGNIYNSVGVIVNEIIENHGINIIKKDFDPALLNSGNWFDKAHIEYNQRKQEKVIIFNVEYMQ